MILLDNAGVGLSSGAVPRTVAEMARDAIAFLDALEVSPVDVLGDSLGGMVAQELALFRPRAVRRMALAGTGPRGRPGRTCLAGSTTSIRRPTLRSRVPTRSCRSSSR